MNYKILFLGKKNDVLTNLCAELCKEKFNKTKIHLSSPNEKIPSNIMDWRGDIIISYLFPHLIPYKLIKKAKIISVNFHPGPPERRGIGCTNYAIYSQEKNYGITFHIMDDKIDSGGIINVKRFKINKNESVYSLTQRAYLYILELYILFLNDISIGKKITPNNSFKWSGAIKTRKDFQEFLQLNKNMSKTEIKKRIYATTYPGREPAKF